MTAHGRPPRAGLAIRGGQSSARAQRQIEPTEEPGLKVSPFRRKLIALGYRLASSISMADDPCWRDPFIEALAPQADERILDFGAGSAHRVVGLAKRFPDTSFVAIDLNRTASKKAAKKARARGIQNVEFAMADANGRLPFAAARFDKATSVLAFHPFPPGGKVEVARELWRVLRRGGTLYIADFDKPVLPRENNVLALTRFLFGRAALSSHIDGSWPTFLTKAGFTGVRRLSSHSLDTGRVGLVRARKR